MSVVVRSVQRSKDRKKKKNIYIYIYIHVETKHYNIERYF